jgi:hypothetical protein
MTAIDTQTNPLRYNALNDDNMTPANGNAHTPKAKDISIRSNLLLIGRNLCATMPTAEDIKQNQRIDSIIYYLRNP